jgi:hypothetical protein
MDPTSRHSSVSGERRLGAIPCGRWRGFWIQSNRRCRTDLNILFRAGRIGGDGNDWLGDFTIRGDYSPEGGEVRWTKVYRDGRRVQYRGFIDGAHGIWGHWEVAGRGKGGFQIWPDADAGVDEPPVALGAGGHFPGLETSVIDRRDADAWAG